MEALRSHFEGWLASLGLTMSDQQWSQFELYFQELTTWNERMNLTAITDKHDVFEKHFYDSVTVAAYTSFEGELDLADIGSGAGFPGVPLKIMFPHIHLTIIDSLKKRIAFLDHLVETLGLSDVRCIHGRAEDAGRSAALRDRFDIVTARAVARLNVLNELCLPFVRENGLFIAMKGAQGKEELVESSRSLKELNAVVERAELLKLPTEESSRTIILIRKHSRTPKKYPRKAGIPAKSPL